MNSHSTPFGTWRYRLNMTSTVKDGYRVGDATVEFTESAPSTTDYDDMSKEFKERLIQIIEDGEQVAAQLNTTRHQTIATQKLEN